MILLLLAQAVSDQPDTRLAAPDIVLDARAQIREVRIEQRGEARLTVSGAPGSDIRVEKPAGDGRTRLRNVDVSVRAEARVADPRENPQGAETAHPN